MCSGYVSWLQRNTPPRLNKEMEIFDGIGTPNL